ncbi:MAG TPA: hypothetical protein VE035_04070 [Puia sp.]|nr:hypothetical protein [Puia sp.]
MTNFKKLTIRVIIFHFFIIVGAAHAIACIGLIEIFGIPYGFGAGSDPLSFSLTEPYERSLGPAAIFALAGQVLLILSLLIKKFNARFWVKLAGLSLLWLSYYYLIHNYFDDPSAELSFWAGLPFLISSGILVYKLIREKRNFYASGSLGAD